MDMVTKLCFLVIVLVAADRQTLKMDFDWKFLALDSNLPECPANTFPMDMTGVQCFGLSQVSAQNEDQCARQCCALSNCATYQWCPPGSSCNPSPSCWIGQMDNCSPNKPWQSRGRNVTSPVFPKCTSPYCMPGYDDSSWRSLDIPHDFVVEGAFNETAEQSHGYLPKGMAWYRKHFLVPIDVKGQSVWIYFEGVYRDSVVYLNGQGLGNHPSGYTSFYYPVSNYLVYGGQNVLAVSVDSRSDEGWWYEGGGIYRHVWMVITDPLHVVPWGVYAPYTVTGLISYPESGPISSSASVSVQTTIVNEYTTSTSFTLQTLIYEKITGTVVGRTSTSSSLNSGQTNTFVQTISLSNISLWDITSPFLYTVVSNISAITVIDIVETTIGFRTIEFNKDSGFYLNGKSVKIKGFCNHQDFAGVGTALPRRVNEFRVKKLQEMGANGWRMSHNPPNPELLEITDELGMLVWDENRNFGDSAQYQSDMATLPLRDRNHPSIIIWSLCNEFGCMEGANDTNALRIANLLKSIVRQYDTTRPISAAWNSDLNDLLYGWGPKVMDLQGVNYNYGELDPYHKMYPNKPMIGSETASCTGARGIYITNDALAHESIFSAHGCAKDWWTADAQRQFMAGGFAWTGFDYKGEPTPYAWPCINSNFGVIDIAGFPKDTFWYYQSWWISQPVLHMFPHWNAPENNNSISVASCNSSESSQLFKFTGSGSTPGQLISSSGLCIDATCASVSTGCVPLKLVQCTPNNQNQLFVHNSDKSFSSVGATGGCMDLWNSGDGPDVGVYTCDGGYNQHWVIQGTVIRSDSTGDRCITIAPQKPIWVYSNADSVELFVNGVSKGKQQNPTLDHVQWNTEWTAGSIEARGYDKSGKVVKNQIIETTGNPSGIKLVVEFGEQGIQADKQDVALIQAIIVDDKQRTVPTASNKVTFSVNSFGTVIGVGNGDPSSHEPDKSNSRSAFNGYVRVIVQSTDVPGTIEVTASSPGLTSDKVSFQSVKPSKFVPTI